MPGIGTPIVNHAHKYCISNFQDEREIFFFFFLKSRLAWRLRLVTRNQSNWNKTGLTISLPRSH